MRYRFSDYRQKLLTFGDEESANEYDGPPKFAIEGDEQRFRI